MASTTTNKKSSANKKKQDDSKRCRKWTEDELEQYSIVLSDEENCFAATLEKLALKKSSNNEVFMHVKKLFDKILHDPDFKTQNEKNNFHLKDGTVMKYLSIDTSIEKLRRKYANLKTEWRRIRDRVKNGSGLSPKNEPLWYNYLNPIFSETNEDIDLAAESADLSFRNEIEENTDKETSSDTDIEPSQFSLSVEKKRRTKKCLSSTRTVHSDSEEDDCDKTEMENASAKKSKPSGKVVAAPHQKRKAVRSQQQALSQLASSVDQIASVQMKKHKLTLEVAW